MHHHENKHSCYIGLTQWQHAQWQETLLQRSQFDSPLKAYAKHFSSVEGNTTFYGLPKPETVQQWHKDSSSDFRFCFKFPQSITHQQQLSHCAEETTEFLERLAPLAQKLGILCIQLPASFGYEALPQLKAFLSQLPKEFTYGVEVRHLDFFDKHDKEKAFNQLLSAFNVNRITFDTRALFAHPASDAISLKAKEHKPQLPVHAVCTGDAPMVRFITPLDWQWGQTYLAPWIAKTVEWLDAGKTPYFFFHTPDNAEAPALAKYFVEQVHQHRPQCCLLSPWNETPITQTGFF